MSSVKSYFQEVEVFETSDGEVFVDDGAAEEHQRVLNQREQMTFFFSNPERFVLDNREFIEKVLKENQENEL